MCHALIIVLTAAISFAAACPISAMAQERTMRINIIEKPLPFEANGNRIPGLLTLPEAGEAEWAVVFVPGSFMNDIDGNYLPEAGNPFTAKPHTYKDLAEGLARNGVAAFRHARAGVTVLDAEAAAAHRHFADRTTVVAEAVRAVRRAAPGITRIALAGHSEGGTVCLLLLSRAPEVKVDAYISLSAPGRRFFDIMLQQTEASVKDGMASFGPMKFPFAAYKEAMSCVRNGRPVPPDLIKQLPPFGVYAMDEASKGYLREYDQVDPLALIGRLSLPVLVVQGGQDTSVFPDNADRLIEARKGNPAPTATAFFPELQHFYKAVPPGLDPMAVFGLETESDPGVAAAIAAWLKKTGKSKGA